MSLLKAVKASFFGQLHYSIAFVVIIPGKRSGDHRRPDKDSERQLFFKGSNIPVRAFYIRHASYPFCINFKIFPYLNSASLCPQVSLCTDASFKSFRRWDLIRPRSETGLERWSLSPALRKPRPPLRRSERLPPPWTAPAPGR